jgi:DNA helicase II / ATP-dependent DNA helicase PcrA
VQWPTIEDEGQGLAEYANWLVENRGYDPGDILILTTRRLLGYAIRDRLQNLQTPVHSFYHEEALEEDAAQVAFTLLNLLANPKDRVALRWWLGHDSPSARREAYRRLRAHCEATGDSPWTVLTAMDAGVVAIPQTGALLTSFRELRERLDRLRPLAIAEVIHQLMPDGDRDVSALRSAALLALPRSNTFDDLFDIVRATVTQPETPAEADYIRVMSLHKSKGLTSKVVLVAGCIQGLIPVQDFNQTPAEQLAMLQEQRRLFYVAITSFII